MTPVDGVLAGSYNHLMVVVSALIAVLAVGYFILAVFPTMHGDESGAICAWVPLEVKCALYGAMFYLAVLHSAEPQQFIYFQF